MIPEFPAEVDENGKLTIDDRPALKRWLHTLKGKVYVTIKKKRKTRSNLQRKYQWGCVYKIVSEHTGYTLDECHQLFGKMFLKYEKNGHVFIKSTTKLSTVEFEDYMESIRRFASMELSLWIPEPNEPNHFYYEHKSK
jgi:hypothetical protein